LSQKYKRLNVGITDGRDLWFMLLSWVQVPCYTHKVSQRLIQPFKS
jgi:hypothetical protein